jgi:predicted ATPase
MKGQLVEVEVENFRSLLKMSLPLRPLNVLVGPNGSGKTTVLEVFRFLADVIRTDLEPALQLRGGFDEVCFWGGNRVPELIRIKLTATWTTHSSLQAPDEYELRIKRAGERLTREEHFSFKRTKGRGRRITIRGKKVSLEDTGVGGRKQQNLGIQDLSSGLSTLPRLSDDQGGVGVKTVADRLASFKFFDVRVEEARRPGRFPRARVESLEDDAANLAAFLLSLSTEDQDAWQRLVEDARQVLPQLEDIDFEYPSGPDREVIVVLRERGLRRATKLADASFGTIRLLGLLALLYDPNPNPPAFICIEEIDHGLHPQALELVVDRLREASERTQFLIATHSPALADRLAPEELIICERKNDGSSVIPALSVEEVERIVSEAEDLPLGELWFSGALGGDL